MKQLNTVLIRVIFFSLTFCFAVSSTCFANYSEVALYIGQRDNGASIQDYRHSISKSLPKAILKQNFVVKEHFIEVQMSPSSICKIGILQVTPPRANGKSAIVFYGNAQNSYDAYKTMGHYEDSFLNQGFQVFIMDYPGYGISECKPVEETVIKSAQSSYNYIQGFVHGPVTVLGFALGGAVATQVASANDGVDALILVNTFADIRTMTDEADQGWLVKSFIKSAIKKKGYDTTGNEDELQAELFSRNKYVSKEYVLNVKAPVLLIHGTKDSVIPQSQYLKLREALVLRSSLANSCFEAEILTSSKHGQLMSLDAPKYTPSFWQRIFKFLNTSNCF